ncbi:helix-turn-helix domain-containing protein [Clostridium paridis]|uniref:Helix-turn-helix transcriptional regulator n=1 Tax=Clostridium paridis TaxID=2803863 RepID=A0A937FK82_9CLOT|nr:helix-turn-helix transcriptional regulator [Clostridium paridis]MBL4934068.1 helix-turn-helix transcriptional regulator [Clostridium paridis]
MEMNEKIKQKREELGLTLQEVGEYLGVSKATVQRYESGEIKNLKLDSIEKLAEILKVSPAYLMGWEEQRKLNKLETLAAHFDGDDFTKDDLDDIENFINYIKSKKK